MVFRTVDNSEPVLTIEIKHPGAYHPHDDMVKQWTAGKKKARRN
jgi:hypothetical protein